MLDVKTKCGVKIWKKIENMSGNGARIQNMRAIILANITRIHYN